MSTYEKIKQMTTKPIIHAAVSSAGITMMAEGKKSFAWGTTDIPVWQLGAVLGAGSSVVVETASNFILPHIPGNAKFQHLESMVLHLSGSGIVFTGAAKLLNGNLNAEELTEAYMTHLAGAIALAGVYNELWPIHSGIKAVRRLVG